MVRLNFATGEASCPESISEGQPVDLIGPVEDHAGFTREVWNVGSFARSSSAPRNTS